MKLGGKISGPGFLAIVANATAVANAYITNDLNDYTGGTLISGQLSVGYDGNTISGSGRLGSGPVVLGGAGILNLYGTNNLDPNTRVLVLQAGSDHGPQVDLLGLSTRIGSLEGDGRVYLDLLSSPSCKLYTGGNNLSTDFMGIIYDRDGTGSLVKEGTGTFTLSGYNTYRGTTTVYQGTLLVNGTVMGPTVVTNGATLGGTGVITNTLTLTGGNLAPGAAGKGVLTVSGTVTFDAASAWQVTLGGINAAVDYGQLSVRGAINLNGAVLSITLTSVPLIGQQYMIMNNPAGATVGSTRFASVHKVSGTFGGRTYWFTINYNGGDGNDIVLTCIPSGAVFSFR